MSTAVLHNRLELNSVADSALKAAAGFWFVVAVIGQWIFAFYIAAFYGGWAVRGDLLGWNKILPHGYVAGNTIGNTALAAHLYSAATITLSGALQLIPQIRARFPIFHRWNGRIYVLIAFIMGLTGLYLAHSGRHVAGDQFTRRRYQRQRGPHHVLRRDGLALCSGSRFQNSSPLGPSPVSSCQWRFVLPDRDSCSRFSFSNAPLVLIPLRFRARF